jgi:hypothetical protein
LCRRLNAFINISFQYKILQLNNIITMAIGKKNWMKHSLFVRVGANVLKDVRDSNLELIRDGGNPRVVLHFENLLLAEQVKAACNTTEASMQDTRHRESIPSSGGSTVRRLPWI